MTVKINFNYGIPSILELEHVTDITVNRAEITIILSSEAKYTEDELWEMLDKLPCNHNMNYKNVCTLEDKEHTDILLGIGVFHMNNVSIKIN